MSKRSWIAAALAAVLATIGSVVIVPQYAEGQVDLDLQFTVLADTPSVGRTGVLIDMPDAIWPDVRAALAYAGGYPDNTGAQTEGQVAQAVLIEAVRRAVERHQAYLWSLSNQPPTVID